VDLHTGGVEQLKTTTGGAAVVTLLVAAAALWATGALRPVTTITGRDETREVCFIVSQVPAVSSRVTWQAGPVNPQDMTKKFRDWEQCEETLIGDAVWMMVDPGSARSRIKCRIESWGPEGRSLIDKNQNTGHRGWCRVNGVVA
jgi:hypothetical protein